LTVLCAYKPYAPVAPTSYVNTHFVIINWITPFDGGSPILGYRILIQKHDRDFSEDLAYCDGSQYKIFTETNCIIPLDSLTSAPFNLL